MTAPFEHFERIEQYPATSAKQSGRQKTVGALASFPSRHLCSKCSIVQNTRDTRIFLNILNILNSHQQPPANGEKTRRTAPDRGTARCCRRSPNLSAIHRGRCNKIHRSIPQRGAGFNSAQHSMMRPIWAFTHPSPKCRGGWGATPADLRPLACQMIKYNAELTRLFSGF